MEMMDESPSILAYLGLSGLIKLTLSYMWKDRKPRNLEKAGRVTGLCLYPVKSTKAINLTQIQCSSEKAAHSGPIIDRQWVVLSEDLRPVNARLEPALLKLVSSFHDGQLVITTPDKKQVQVDPKAVEKSGKSITLKITAAGVGRVAGLDCGDVAAQFLSTYLNKPGFRLLYCSPSGNDRRVAVGGNPKLNQWTRQAKDDDVLYFHETIPFHMQVEESIAELNTRLDKPVTFSNFRPNIVVSSGLKPYSEDSWSDVFIGDVRFKTIKLCDRCGVPTIDPDTCQKDPDYQPTKTLSSYRSLRKSFGPYMGIDLVVQRPGTIRVGDAVYIARGEVLDA